ncbi:MAG: hypothetical protein LBK06_03430 [Planctomycetaceae bacterium]|jgi:hypothetical protein|nr:hypothetical protein [Planctomycetaceae bacterium]
MNDFTVIKELAAEDFLALCADDDMFPRDIAYLETSVSDLLHESDIVLEQDEFSKVVKELTLSIIEELLTKNLLNTWFSYTAPTSRPSGYIGCDGYFSHDPVLLPINEIIRRIEAGWRDQPSYPLRFFEGACFLTVKNDGHFKEAPPITHILTYKKIAEEFINDVISADIFIDRFMSQYKKDFMERFGNSLNPTFPRQDISDALEKALFDGHISFKQYFHCWHILEGYPPEMVNVKMILEMIMTDCYCYRIQDKNNPNYLNADELKKIIKSRFDEY